MVPPALVIVIGTLVLLPLLNTKVPPASTGLYVVPRLVTVTVEPVVILVIVGVDVVVVVLPDEPPPLLVVQMLQAVTIKSQIPVLPCSVRL